MDTVEQIPTRWDSDRDERFFRIVQHLFPCAFLEGASVLLGSYDPEPADAGRPSAAAPSESVPSTVPGPAVAGVRAAGSASHVVPPPGPW